MNSATRTTLLMLVLAIVSVAVSMYYYPWEKVTKTDAEVGTPLFEEYKVSNVRGIDILTFNSDRQTMDRMKLVRRGEKWVVPSRQDFEASESARVAIAVNSLNERTVFEVISENQEDHIKYGVVDPAEFEKNKNVAALGRKMTLTDRNNKTIADIIVGSALKNDAKKRYVRIPGKPRVYVIDFDQLSMAGMLTEFSGWVSPNLLDLQTQQDGNGRQLRKVTVDNYRIEAKEGEPPVKQAAYKAVLVPTAGKLKVQLLNVKSGDSWSNLPTTPAQEGRLTAAVISLLRLVVDDVGRKDPEFADACGNPSADVDASVLERLSAIGFYHKGLEPDGWEFDSANGRVDVATSDGVLSKISIGRVGGASSAGGGELNYFMMVNSGVDYEYLREPKRPAGLENDESEQNKAFLRTVKAWKAKVELASRTASDLNAVHGDWYYLVGDNVVKALRPDLPLPSVEAKDGTTDSPVVQEEGSDNKEQPAEENGSETRSEAATEDGSTEPAKPAGEAESGTEKKE